MNARYAATKRHFPLGAMLPQRMTLAWYWFAALLVYALLVPTQLVPAAAARFITDIGWTVGAALAALSSLRAARALTGRERSAWLLFAAAYAAWTGGQIVWDIYELALGVVTPFPSAADTGYLMLGPLIIVGLYALLSTQPERRLTWLRVANIGLIVCSIAVILIAMLTRPFTSASFDFFTALLLVSKSSTMAIATIIAMYILWSYPWGSRLKATALVTAALVIQMIAYLFYARELMTAHYSVASAVNIAWLIAFACQHCAAEARLSATSDAETGAAATVNESQGWLEALVPGILLLCMATSGIALASEATPYSIYLASIVVAVFAVVLALREGLLHVRGQQLNTKLTQAAIDLAGKTEVLRTLDAQRIEQEHEIEAMAHAGGVGLWDWDMKGVVRTSLEWKHQLGYDEHEVSNAMEEWHKRLHPDDFERVTRAFAEYIANPQGDLVVEQRLLHHDGTYRWIVVRGSVVRDANGVPQRMLGSQIDITERKEMELSLRESEARYRELTHELETRVAERTSELTEAYLGSQSFAYAVAHDLKAPLRAMNGFSQLLAESASSQLTTEELEYVTRIHDGAVQMALLIDALLDYSRLEHRELSLRAVDCRGLIEDVIQSMVGSIQAANATVTVTAAAPCEVSADPEGLRIVFRNLLDN
ncbi:MAG TPA: PAS domain-containing protein, partial [Povalibacter sp.]